MADCIELERGLCYFYEQQDEFERRGLPIEKQVAFGWEAGYQAGQCEIRVNATKIFKPDKGVE